MPIDFERIARFSKRNADDSLTGCHRGQPALLLIVAAGDEAQRQGRHHRARHKWPRRADASHLFHQQDDIEERPVAAAQIGRNEKSLPADLGHAPPQRFIEAARLEGDALRGLRRTVLA
jgi:hypothetical protein